MDLIEVDRSGNVAVVVPKVKRLDASVAPAFRQAVVGAVEGGERRIVVDLAGVEFLDSSGLGALISILKALGQQGAMAVCGPNAAVMGLFKLTRMDRVFAIHPGRREALASLGA